MRQSWPNGLALMCCHHDIKAKPEELVDEFTIDHSRHMLLK